MDKRGITALLVTVPIVMFIVLEVPIVAADFAAHPGSVGGDLNLYLERTASFLAGHGFYLDRQLHGPYQWQVGDALYPPIAMWLFLPFLVLPAILWWAIPLGIIAGTVAYWRPKPWAWPLIALCLAWPFTLNAIGYGNPVMWIAAIMALATRWKWPAVLVVLKPSLAIFALFGIRHPDWRTAALALGFASLLWLPLWPQYVAVVRDGNLPLDYSLHDIPLVALSLIAWLARSRVLGVVAEAHDPEQRGIDATALDVQRPAT